MTLFKLFQILTEGFSSLSFHVGSSRPNSASPRPRTARRFPIRRSKFKRKSRAKFDPVSIDTLEEVESLKKVVHKSQDNVEEMLKTLNEKLENLERLATPPASSREPKSKGDKKMDTKPKKPPPPS